MELISAKEAMSILSWDRTPSQFYAHVAQGKIPMAQRVGHAMLFSRKAIEALRDRETEMEDTDAKN